jgi:hypothetical protein
MIAWKVITVKSVFLNRTPHGIGDNAVRGRYYIVDALPPSNVFARPVVKGAISCGNVNLIEA